MNDLKQKFKDSQLAAQRYVLGQMSEADAQEFEAYFLSKPDILELIEVTQELHLGLKESNAMASQSVSSESDSKNKMRNSVFGQLTRWLSIPVPAFAVLALVALFSPLVLNGISSSNSLDTGLVSDVELVNFSTTTTRSSQANNPTINLSGISGNAALMIKVKSVKHKEYRLKLISVEASKPVWTSKPFQVSALRDHLVTIPKLNVQDDLSIEVTGINADSSETPVVFCHYSEVCN